MKITLKNNITLNKIELDCSVDGGWSGGLIINMELPPNTLDGEYTYTLYDNEDNIIGNGIIQIGNYNKEQKTYTNEKKYKQYKG